MLYATPFPMVGGVVEQQLCVCASVGNTLFYTMAMVGGLEEQQPCVCASVGNVLYYANVCFMHYRL